MSKMVFHANIHKKHQIQIPATVKHDKRKESSSRESDKLDIEEVAVLSSDKTLTRWSKSG